MIKGVEGSRHELARDANPRTRQLLHADKFASRFAEGLMEFDLAVRANDWNAYYVEPSIGRWYMTALAIQLANVASVEMVLVADKRTALGPMDPSFRTLPPRGRSIDEHAQSVVSRKSLSRTPRYDRAYQDARDALLADLLPAPLEQLKAQIIAEFKDKWSTQLFEFRIAIEGRLVQLATTQQMGASPLDFQQAQFRQELLARRDEVVELIRASKGGLVKFGSLTAVVGAALNTVVGVATLNPLQAFLGSLAMAGGIAAAGAGFRKRRHKRRSAEARPLASRL